MDDKHWVEKEIDRITKIRNHVDRLYELRQLAEDVANEFTYSMSFIDNACDDILNKSSKKACDETGYYDVTDITGDINPTLWK